MMTNIAAAYDQWSATYDADHNPTRDLDRFVTKQIPGSRTIATTLEAGCGTGKNTILFAARSDGVLAMDFSRGSLDKQWNGFAQIMCCSSRAT